MKQRYALAMVAGVLIALTGGGAAQAADVDATRQMIEPMTAMDYFKEAALSDMLEIQSSELALERSRKDQVRAFAQRMVEHHTKSTEMLKKAAAEATKADTKLGVPAQLRESQRELLQELSAAGPGEFDEKYMEMQVAAHQKALTLHRGYAETGTAPRLREAAAQIAAIVERHLEAAQAMTSATGGVR